MRKRRRRREAAGELESEEKKVCPWEEVKDD